MIIRISLVVVLILIGIFLYTIGKQHKILIDNRDITVGDIAYRAGTTYNIWVDNQEIGMIKKGERIKVMVTGVSHKIIVEEIKDKVLSGKKYEKMFKLKVNEDIVINIPAMINDLNEWINKTN
jgi:hypothetical protein